MEPLTKGRYHARLALGTADLHAAQALRALAFGVAGVDADQHDNVCKHILVEDLQTGQLAACCRVLPLASGQDINLSYSAQFYDLERLSHHAGPLLELGRFCLNPTLHDPDILRIAWGALTRMVDATSAQMLFGCTSFAGTDPAPLNDALSYLCQNHPPPEQWHPRAKAPEVVHPGPVTDPRFALQTLPALLRTYLAMGGWVSDHAVIDRKMNTIHVFTGMSIATIPAARVRALRAVAGR